MFKGDLAVGGERWKTAELDPLAIQNIHIQALCSARLTGRGDERVGMGILEQLVLGVHEPSGPGPDLIRPQIPAPTGQYPAGHRSPPPGELPGERE